MALALMTLIAGWVGGAAAATPYALQPGDTVRFSISELPGLDAEATIGIDGTVQVPRLGRLDAAGLSLSELQSAVDVIAAGRTIPFFAPDGTRQELTLVGTEIAVEIAAYRPVYITGDVARPGEIDFKPGMTVRIAIATVGGLSSVPVLFEDAAREAPALQSAYQTAALAHAGALVRLWGIDATLQRDPRRPLNLKGAVQIGPDVLDRLVSVERRRVELTLAEVRTERTGLTERTDYLEERVARLEETLTNSEAALALEEEAVARVQALSERGFAAAARVSDARQAQLLLASRVLEVQDSVARFTLERDDTRTRLARLEEQFQAPLIAERAEVLAQIWTMQSELTAARRRVEFDGQTLEAFGATPQPQVEITIFRGATGAQTTVEAERDALVLPGDVIDVTVTYDYSVLDLTLPTGAPDAPVSLPDIPAVAPTIGAGEDGSAHQTPAVVVRETDPPAQLAKAAAPVTRTDGQAAAYVPAIPEVPEEQSIQEEQAASPAALETASSPGSPGDLEQPGTADGSAPLSGEVGVPRRRPQLDGSS